jgi:hypothetical protein
MDDRTPPGERDAFNLLAAGPDDWVVLHSLDLAPWNHSLRTEIDFVVIVPDTGILCIEVKSHEAIAFNGERWYPETISRSPFKQAGDAAQTFHRHLSELIPASRAVPVVSCCIFPRARFEISANLSVQPWELMDLLFFRSFVDGNAFCADLKCRLERGIAADARLKRLPSRLFNDQIEAIVRACIPVQKWPPNAREEIARREAEIDRILQEQQKPALQLAAMNPRLVIRGAAGTGKTLIAIEVARRWTEMGRRVGLLCYNQLVGDWMKDRIAHSTPSLPNLIAGRAIRVMAEMTGVCIPDRPSRDFWDIELPYTLEERLTDPDCRAVSMFDCLVLDEAQDILARPKLWQCLTLFLSGGIERGVFALFGDFDHQVLAERHLMQTALAGVEALGRPVRWKLSENCRNYRIIGDTAVRLAGMTGPVYSGYLRSGGSLQNYDIFFYESEQDQMEKLRQWLREMKDLGYRSRDVTLLSFRADQFSAAERLKTAGYKLRPARQAGNLTSHATVHSFKGMENKIIILTDVVLGDVDFSRDLFYTGLTRATESVRVLCRRDSQETILAWLSRRIDP